MRISGKYVEEYFDQFVKPIAPRLSFNPIQDGYSIHLHAEPGERRYQKALVFKDTAKEILKWMEGFVKAFNYFQVDKYRDVIQMFQEIHEPVYMSAMAEDAERGIYDEVMDAANAIKEGDM